MEADSFRIAKVFSNGGDIHFCLPYFQREYAWKKEEWKVLWNDILDLYPIYNDEMPPEHFMGSLVVIEEGMVSGTIPKFKLVDGQQRLITISIILCALGDYIKNLQPNLTARIRKYITNPDEHGDLYFKLLPTAKYQDRDTYFSILQGKEQSNNNSQIYPAYQYYLEEMENFLQNDKEKAEKLFLLIINSLQVVFINLNNDERPYQIFESLNAKGKPLTQADLVRNYIAMKLPESHQAEIFENSWSKIEDLLQEKRTVGRSRLGELTAFLRHYLAFRNGVLGNKEHVYARFRDRIEIEFNTTELFEKELSTLKRFSEHYDRFLRPENEPDKEIRDFLERFNTLEFSTGYPFLLAMYDAYKQENLDHSQLLAGLNILENYVIRRYLAGEPTNYLNRVFPALWKEINPLDFIPSLKKALLQRNYPNDIRVHQSILTRSMYENSAPTRNKTILVLETINRKLSLMRNAGGYTVLDGVPTIEHIMPQTLSYDWKNDLGENYEQIYDQYLDTLGNLTIVTSEWNSSLSNSSFSIKKPKLKNHGLILNSEYFERAIDNHWNESTINNRAEYLVQQILKIWPALGDQTLLPKTTNTKPVTLVFLGQSFKVESWRDVAQKTTETIIQLSDRFEEIANQMPSFLSENHFPQSDRKLSNGWFMNVNLSAKSLRNNCKILISRAGLTDRDWYVETK